MNKDMHFLLASEAAAIAAYPYIGSKNKNLLDKAAVNAFMKFLTKDYLKIKVKVGEGDLDKAPMLFINQENGNEDAKFKYDIAIDPIEGTTNAAYKKGASATTCLFARKEAIRILPETYMEKIFVREEHSKYVDIINSIYDNVNNILKVQEKTSIVIMDKPRHDEIIKKLKSNPKVEVHLINDGDICGAISVAIGNIDICYGIGGSCEGTIMAGLSIAIKGKYQGRFIKYRAIYPNEDNIDEIENNENILMTKYNWKFNKIYDQNEFVSDLKVRFVSTIITGDKLLPYEIKKIKNNFYTTTFFANYGIIREIKSKYNLDRIHEVKKRIKLT